MAKNSVITGIQIYGILGFSITRVVNNKRQSAEKKYYEISLTNKDKAYRRIERISKMIAMDIQRKWNFYNETGQQI